MKKLEIPKPNDKPVSKEAVPLHKQMAMGQTPQTGCGKGKKA